MKKLIKSKNNKTRVFFNTIFVVAETVVDKGIFFVINILLARYFAPELFGEYTTALGYATFFSMFCDIGIKGTIIRSIRKDSAHEKEHVTNALIIKTSLVVLSYSALALSLFFVNFNINTIYLILIFGIVRIGDEYRKVFYAIINAHEKFLWSSISNTIFALSFLIVTILVIFFHGTYFHVAWSRFAVVIILVSLLAVNILRRTTLKFSYEKFKEFLPQMFYFGLGTFFSNSFKTVNVVIISMMLGTLYTGYFNNAFMFFVSLFFIPGNISRVLMPHLMKESVKDNKKKFQFTYDFYTRFYSILSFYLCIFFFLFAKDIILLFYGEKYLPAVPILRILAFGLPPLFSVNNLMLTLLDKQKQSTVIRGITFIINIVSNFTLVYFFKAEGAAVAVIITYLTMNSMSASYLVKNDYIHFNNIWPVLIKIIGIAGTTCIVYFLLLKNYNFFISFPAVSIIYAILVLIIIANKDDVRIVKEILGKK